MNRWPVIWKAPCNVSVGNIVSAWPGRSLGGWLGNDDWLIIAAMGVFVCRAARKGDLEVRSHDVIVIRCGACRIVPNGEAPAIIESTLGIV